LDGLNIDKTGSGSCPVADFVKSNVELSASYYCDNRCHSCKASNLSVPTLLAAILNPNFIEICRVHLKLQCKGRDGQASNIYVTHYIHLVDFVAGTRKLVISACAVINRYAGAYIPDFDLNVLSRLKFSDYILVYDCV
jgi:hypothetical protein